MRQFLTKHEAGLFGKSAKKFPGSAVSLCQHEFRGSVVTPSFNMGSEDSDSGPLAWIANALAY